MVRDLPPCLLADDNVPRCAKGKTTVTCTLWPNEWDACSSSLPFNIIHALKGWGQMNSKTNRSLLYFVLACQFTRWGPKVFVLPVLPVQIMNHFHLLYVFLHFALLPSALPALIPSLPFPKAVAFSVTTRGHEAMLSLYVNFHLPHSIAACAAPSNVSHALWCLRNA